MKGRQQKADGSASTEERLLAATVEVLAERGYRGATTREIADAAGVNEVTLFRLFSTKDNLVAEALVQLAESDLALVPEPTGDVRADLEKFTTLMAARMSEGGQLLMVILPEVTRLPEEHARRVRKAAARSRETNLALFHYYQESGELNAEIGDDIWTAFTGPLLARVLFAEFHRRPVDHDVHQHVELFLNGCRSDSSRSGPAADR